MQLATNFGVRLAPVLVGIFDTYAFLAIEAYHCAKSVGGGLNGWGWANDVQSDEETV